MAPSFSIASALSKGKGVAQDALDLEAASDPTDWVSSSFPFLKTLDSSLRCTLCYDIYTAPVVLRECHHTFCSVCIRSHINQPEDKGRFCPQCRQTKANDGELVPAQGLEEAAAAWKLARQELMQASQEMQALQSAGNASGDQQARGEGSSSPAEVESISGGTGAATPRGTKRKLETPEAADISVADSGGRRTRQSTAAARGPASSTSTQGRSANNSPAQASNGGLKVTEMKPTDIAPCPICNQEYTLAKLNAHLDQGCDGSKGPAETSPANTSRSAWFVRPNGENSSFRNGGRAPFEGVEKLRRPQYVGKSDREMKKLLEKERLPITGTHQRMVARHRQWVNIFNANLDAAPAKRQTESQLRKALSEWDRGKDEEERSRARGGVVSDEKAKSWAQDHKSDFAKLVESARSSHRKNKDTTRNMPIVTEAKAAEASASASSSHGGANGSSASHRPGEDNDDDVEWVPNPADMRSPGLVPASPTLSGDFFA